MEKYWFEAQLRQVGTPDRFPIHKAESNQAVRDYMSAMFPHWEIVRIVPIMWTRTDNV